ncbi:MAG: AsnC family protein [Candidatus Marsarchaeota archaeon]|nr:AsnC family protein [Candidatus Marsarchaeota archaeon]
MPKKSKRIIPENVLKALDKLKAEYKGHLSLVFINGNYYVNETAVHFSEKKGKKVTVARYIGKIANDGAFSEARHRKKETEVKSIKEFISASESSFDNILYPDDIDLKLLELLSSNGRASTMELSNSLGLSQAACAYRLKRAPTGSKGSRRGTA